MLETSDIVEPVFPAATVVLVRDEEKTVLTMANDFQGEPKDFAVVIPVPTFIEREQIAVVR